MKGGEVGCRRSRTGVSQADMWEGYWARAHYRKGAPACAEGSKVARVHLESWVAVAFRGLPWLSCQMPSQPAAGTGQRLAAAEGQAATSPPAPSAALGALAYSPHVGLTPVQPSPHPAQPPEAHLPQTWPSLPYPLPQAPPTWAQNCRPPWSLARVAKYHRLEGLNLRKLFPRGSSSQRLEVQGHGAGRLGLPEASLT